MSALLQGSISLVVQSATPLAQLPASALQVQGGTVTSTSPVEGSNGQLFAVDVNTAKGASFLAMSTAAGVGLSNGLTSAQSNTVHIQLDDAAPQVHGPYPMSACATPASITFSYFTFGKLLSTCLAGATVVMGPSCKHIMQVQLYQLKRECSWLQVSISSGSGYQSGQTVEPSFTISFGERVTETDPRKLYTLTGVNRTDVVYDYGAGNIYITAYISGQQQNLATDITCAPAPHLLHVPCSSEGC